MVGLTTERPSHDTVAGATERDGPGGASALEWAAVVLHCPLQTLIGRRFVIDTMLRFGRVAADDVDVVIADSKMSRRHATLTRAGLVLELRDEGSSNGTRINGVGVRTHAVASGDVVRTGETLFEISSSPASAPNADPTLIGNAPAFLDAVEGADKVAPSDLPVLILGETGTGKDLLARRLHERSRRTGNFVAVNCAALPGGLVESVLFGHKKGAFTGASSDSLGFFQQAQGGTLFLDEVGELPLEHQAKLLRALDAREIVPVGGTRCIHVDARLVAATNVDILGEAAQGGFRSDLYARLAGAVIRMPALRARRGDTLVLAQHLLSQEGAHYRFSAGAAERLLLHSWPRNVRELASTMRRLKLHVGERPEVLRTDIEAVLELPVTPAEPASRRPGTSERSPERNELVAQLASLHGNVTRLAAHYGKDGKQIYRWLKRHGLDPRQYRRQ